MDRSEKSIAAIQNGSQESDGIPTDSRCGDQLVERCHNSVGQGIHPLSRYRIVALGGRSGVGNKGVHANTAG